LIDVTWVCVRVYRPMIQRKQLKESLLVQQREAS